MRAATLVLFVLAAIVVSLTALFLARGTPPYEPQNGPSPTHGTAPYCPFK